MSGSEPLTEVPGWKRNSDGQKFYSCNTHHRGLRLNTYNRMTNGLYFTEKIWHPESVRDAFQQGKTAEEICTQLWTKHEDDFRRMHAQSCVTIEELFGRRFPTNEERAKEALLSEVQASLEAAQCLASFDAATQVNVRGLKSLQTEF